jgi:hypothetical protein
MRGGWEVSYALSRNKNRKKISYKAKKEEENVLK